MVTGRIALTAAALALSLPAALWATPAKDVTPPSAAPESQAEQLLRNCAAHRFETVVHEVVDGRPQQSKVKLCGKEGQSDAEWIGTLKDAIQKLKANKDMPAPVRDQIVTALRSEITRLETPLPLLSSPSQTSKFALGGISPASPVSQPNAVAGASLPPPRQIAPAAPFEDYSAIPPLPTAPPPPVHVLAGSLGASLPQLPRPRMNLTCYAPGEADGPCGVFTRDTLLTVHAAEDMPPDTRLSFVRDGDPKADVDLAQLKKGKTARFPIPTDVCRHAVGGRLELKILRSGQEVGSEGPYNLSC